MRRSASSPALGTAYLCGGAFSVNVGHLLVVWVWVFLITNDAPHLSRAYLLSVYFLFFLMKCLRKYFASFLGSGDAGFLIIEF